jgi:hypothetical protein
MALVKFWCKCLGPKSDWIPRVTAFCLAHVPLHVKAASRKADPLAVKMLSSGVTPNATIGRQHVDTSKSMKYYPPNSVRIGSDASAYPTPPSQIPLNSNAETPL